MHKWLILIPACLWLFLFRGYLAGEPAMTRHGLDYYHIVKYMMENFSRGVYPMWDPFIFWGMTDNINARFIGEFNPFHWLYPAFTVLGFSRPQSFIFYTFIYYLVGIFGFYLLANRIFKDTNLAAVSAVLLLYSSLSFTIFNNYCITLLFVPMVWFFYFLTAFAQQPKKYFLLGLTFSTMIVMITYMPFYFVTIFLIFLLFYMALFFDDLKGILQKSFAFIRRNKIFALLCLFGVLVSLIPGLVWYTQAASGEVVLSWRHVGSTDPHSASMSLNTISSGGVGGQLILPWLFSGLANTEHILLFYVPIFAYILILLSLINFLNRKLLLFFFLSVVILLITLTDLTPLHKFLYDNVYYFKLFRNVFYLLYIGTPFFILFCVEQLRLILKRQPKSKMGLSGMIAFILLCHSALALFLYFQEDIVLSSYITVALSCGFFILYFLGLFKEKQSYLFLTLVIIILIQPGEVYYHYVKNNHNIVEWTPTDRFYPRFSFRRPLRSEENTEALETALKIGKSPKQIQDASGFEKWKYTGLPYSYLLHETMEHNILESYVRHKFVLYDNVMPVTRREFDLKNLQLDLLKQKNTAVIFNSRKDKEPSDDSGSKSGKFKFIRDNSPSFEVLSFDLNSIKLKTNFDSPKFLVYNDNFHRGWRAFINGKRTKVFPANYAFKGVWLPKGENVVFFRFGSSWQHALNLFLFFFFFGFLTWCVWEGVQYQMDLKKLKESEQ